MLLLSVQMFINVFMSNPSFLEKTPGSYVQVVKTAYDPATNLGYAVVERYDSYVDGTNHLFWMEPVPFIGQPNVSTDAKPIPYGFQSDAAAFLLANQLAQ